jgi:hypothetical protein
MNILKYIYILRVKELDKLSQFRFYLAFLVAIYITMIAPIIVKLEGLYFTVGLITILMIINNLTSKFLEPLTEKFRIGTIWKIAGFIHLIEMLILFLYFFSDKTMIYVYSFFNIAASLVYSVYSLKMTNQFIKKFPNKIKQLQIFRQNVWNEGYLLGLFISLALQTINLKIVMVSAILLHIYILYYMIKNWNFYDEYFKEI